MSNSISTLLESMRRRRISGLLQRSGTASITVMRADVPSDADYCSGIVLIDRRHLGYLIGGQDRVFRVASGTHRVAVYFGRRGSPVDPSFMRRMQTDTTVMLAKGEHAELLCGIREECIPELKRRSKVFQRRLGILLAWIVGLTACVFFAGRAGLLREAAAWFCLAWGFEGSAARLIYSLATPAGASLMMMLGLMPAMFRVCRQIAPMDGVFYLVQKDSADGGSDTE